MRPQRARPVLGLRVQRRLRHADRILLTAVLLALVSAAVGTGATAASAARRPHARASAATSAARVGRTGDAFDEAAFVDGVMDAEILVAAGAPIRPGDDCQRLTGRRAGTLFASCAAGERDLARELAR